MASGEGETRLVHCSVTRLKRAECAKVPQRTSKASWNRQVRLRVVPVKPMRKEHTMSERSITTVNPFSEAPLTSYPLMSDDQMSVSYTHLTLPTNREV